MKKYDYLIVGSGFFGSVFAQQAAEKGFKVLLIDKRNHTGGNCHTKKNCDINVHLYGAHIFHTSNERVWDYINRFADFNNFVNSPKVYYKGRIFSFPINLMTLHQLWGVVTPAEARDRLDEVIVKSSKCDNLEDWILSQVGKDIYEFFIKGYTLKQWQKHPRQLPASIIKRLPIRLTYDQNYYTDKYQGIPINGYSSIFDKLLENVDVKLGIDYFDCKEELNSKAKKIVYTGKIDEYFDYKYGKLEYRSLIFEEETVEGDFQGNAVVNYTDIEVPHTRIIEHKHFEFTDSDISVITREYPADYKDGREAYYPVGDKKNTELYNKYKNEAAMNKNVLFGGRLSEYKYHDMDDTISAALTLWEEQFPKASQLEK